MLSYETMRGKPGALRSLTGLSPELFATLLADYERALAQQRQARTHTKGQQPRRRAPGAGHPFSHPPATHLLMTLFWLRTYPTFEILGVLFGLAKSNANLNVHATLAILDTLSDFAFERPAADRPKLHSLAAVMDAFPEVRLVIDATEQRIRRPKSTKDDDRQKPYYSGKKKAHTLKVQVGVNPQGGFEAVSPRVPGATHDLTVLRGSGLLDQLDDDEAALMDTGYQGIRKDYPPPEAPPADPPPADPPPADPPPADPPPAGSACSEKKLLHPHKAQRNHPLSDEQKAENRHLARYRIVVEHSLAQLKGFQVLAQVFRQRRERHTRIVRVVASLVNRRIEKCPLKSYAPSSALT